MPSAVFLSYASQDAGPAGRIADALRRAGVEVWLDQGELSSGDAWDARIRDQIRTCALFVAVISASSQARREGYFRREWKLASERTHDMADGTPFLVPVIIDATADAEVLAPGEFRAVQWTRLPGGEVPEAFVARMQALLLGQTRLPSAGSAETASRAAAGTGPMPRPRRVRWLIPAAAGAALLAALALWRPWPMRQAPAPSAVPGPSAKSVAVLAFQNLSPEPGSEYFSDGISEEVLNGLAQISGLKVCARTSSFSFKGKDVPVATIAQSLGVAYLVEGSVLKVGPRVRIMAELVNAADGYSESIGPFDRRVQDVFDVLDEIAQAIAKNLSLRLGVAAAAGPVNSQAVELYFSGLQAFNRRTSAGYAEAEVSLGRALELEPNFARADAALANVWLLREETALLIGRFDQRASPGMERLLAKIQEALKLDPDSSEAHASLGAADWMRWDFSEAERELRAALSLNPNNAFAHHALGRVLLSDGWIEESIAELGVAGTLDPLSTRIFDNQAWALCWAGRYTDAVRAADRAIALQSDSAQARTVKAFALVKLGRLDGAYAAVKPLMNKGATAADDPIRILARAGAPCDPAQLLARVEQGAMGTGKVAGYLALGRKDDALAACDAQSLLVWDWASSFFDPLFDQIRLDPRYLRVVAEVGSAAAHARAQAWRAAHPPESPH